VNRQDQAKALRLRMYVLCSECARLIDLRKMREARRKDKAEAKRAARGTTPAAERCASDRTGGEVMSAATELAPARSRAPSRAVRKRDERVRRVVRKIKKHAAWLDQPHFASLLYAYGALFVRFVDLHSVQAEPIDDLGRPNAITDQLTRIAGRLGQLAAQLGLSPSAERALRHDAATEASHRKWLDLTDAKEELVTLARAASTPEPAATNGTHRPGFTAPA
jgi:hypothetical protein